MTLKSEALELVESLILCEMDEVDFILEDRFLKTHMLDVRQKLMYFYDKEVNLKLTRISIEG